MTHPLCPHGPETDCVICAAEEEVAQENFRKAVVAKKAELRDRASRPLLHRLFPWCIKIEKR